MTAAITAGFFNNNLIDSFVKNILIPAFLFDKVNLFLIKTPKAQRFLQSIRGI